MERVSSTNWMSEVSSTCLTSFLTYLCEQRRVINDKSCPFEAGLPQMNIRTSNHTRRENYRIIPVQTIVFFYRFRAFHLSSCFFLFFCFSAFYYYLFSSVFAFSFFFCFCFFSKKRKKSRKICGLRGVAFGVFFFFFLKQSFGFF